MVMLVGTPQSTLDSLDEVPVITVIDDFKIGGRSRLPLHEDPTFIAKIDRRLRDTKLELLRPPRAGKPLLILDIDHTLYAMSDTVEHPREQMRPYLLQFLRSMHTLFDIALWSATSRKWIDLKVKEMALDDFDFVLIVDKYAMITAFDEANGVFTTKPLRVIWDTFPAHFSPERCLLIDDLMRNFSMNPGNGIRVRQFRRVNMDSDRELLRLMDYLVWIYDADDFRVFDHSAWKEIRRANRSAIRQKRKALSVQYGVDGSDGE
mmetsp:Transcript_29171/g.81598  ORF Transcript_29171/g.81598 Transcript_29171/m.81598 type:complete len:263 (-) Transcript_29171:153-941(-)